ncbi:MAG: hypothetical protein ACFE89_03580 [Candidatus Hodarchaeota archaeon]
MLQNLRHPTQQQDFIWLKRRQRIRPSLLAEELGVSRPFISKAQRQAETRITRLLQYTAAVNRIHIRRASPRQGFAIGYHPATQRRAYIFYSPKLGIQTWYEHEGQCNGCEARDNCIDTINQLAREWQIPLKSGITPSENALHLLTKIKEELGWKH